MTEDIGTYHVRVELEGGRGWIDRWDTGHRYTHGTKETTMLDAELMPPAWASEEELFSTMEFMYIEGDYSCDCNKVLSLARAYQQPIPEDILCGDSMPVKRLTVIRPDASEVDIFASTQSNNASIVDRGGES